MEPSLSPYSRETLTSEFLNDPRLLGMFDERTDGFAIWNALQNLADTASPTLASFGTGDDRDDIARYGLCLLLEAAELINALPWKRWSRNPPDMDHAVEEFSDLLCFVGSIVGLFKRLGFDEVALTLAYIKKVNENKDRFAKYQSEQRADDLLSPRESPKAAQIEGT